MQTYQIFSFQTSAATREILIAFLGQSDFDSFQETDTGFDAYRPVTPDDSTAEKRVLQQIADLAQQFEFEYSVRQLLPQNWNAVWEANFKPIVVGSFCGIRADFHAPLTEVKHEIIINPKMAFGTGHHATTYMVIDLMREMRFSEKTVFDYGCGTGILAILAAKLGAKEITAVDIEIESYENTIENAQENQVNNIDTYHGTLDDILLATFDVILANINRNVILDSLPSLYERLQPKGQLIVSGFVAADETILKEAATKQGFLPLKIKHREDWVAIIFERP